MWNEQGGEVWCGQGGEGKRALLRYLYSNNFLSLTFVFFKEKWRTVCSVAAEGQTSKIYFCEYCKSGQPRKLSSKM